MFFIVLLVPNTNRLEKLAPMWWKSTFPLPKNLPFYITGKTLFSLSALSVAFLVSTSRYIQKSRFSKFIFLKTKTKFFENIEDDAVNNPVWCIDENNKLYLTYGYTIKRIDLLTGKVELGTSLSSMGDVQSLHCKDGTIYASSSALSALNFETHKHTVICDKCSSFLFYKDSIITHYSWAGNDLTRRIDFQVKKINIFFIFL